eukprot:TRINITY_DN66259_c0_g1_i1.p1 TRINITY_DN66259_c0_g1~~TRINITY_DN66259_c0_g1_i1.p1  ORF type:complete len:627 (-),score=113.67 TRINITY_DN66259_c0_g1_i1:364-2181(-)
MAAAGPGNLSASRLRRELAAYHANRPSRFHVSCEEHNLLNLSFLLRGPEGTPYEGGWYWGKLKFPESYPLAPPAVEMCTPNGRFQLNTRICLSVSDFHPESWKPAWGFATVLDGLVTFLCEDTPTVGSVDPPPSAEERRRLAQASAEWNRQNDDFRFVFPDFDDIVKAAEAAGAASRANEQLAEQSAGTSAAEEDAAAADVEAVPPEFSCSICMKVLLDPVSVSCGHTFCKKCVSDSLGYQSRCAICQAPLTGGQAVNMLVKDLVAQRCPKALAKRKAEESAARADATGPEGTAARAAGGVADATQLRRKQSAIDAVGAPVLPLVRLPVVPFPGGQVEVEIPANSALAQALEHAIRGGRKLLVMDENAAFGCCAEVVQVQRGQQRGAGAPSLAALRGKFRCQLMEEPRLGEDGVELGRFDPFFDESLAPAELEFRAREVAIGGPGPQGEQLDTTGPATTTSAELLQDAFSLVESQLKCIGDHGPQQFWARYGKVPNGPAQTAVSAEGMEELSFWLASVLKPPAFSATGVSAQRRRQMWLESGSTRARIEDCRNVLVESRGRLVLDLPGADSWMNAGRSGMGNILLLLALLVLLLAKAAGWLPNSV